MTTLTDAWAFRMGVISPLYRVDDEQLRRRDKQLEFGKITAAPVPKLHKRWCAWCPERPQNKKAGR
jgi:hypothetical protein